MELNGLANVLLGTFLSTCFKTSCSSSREKVVFSLGGHIAQWGNFVKDYIRETSVNYLKIHVVVR